MQLLYFWFYDTRLRTALKKVTYLDIEVKFLSYLLIYKDWKLGVTFLDFVDFLKQENYFGINQQFSEVGVKTNPEEALSESTLASGSKDTINLQTLRPMEANIFLTLYDIKVELTKVR